MTQIILFMTYENRSSERWVEFYVFENTSDCSEHLVKRKRLSESSSNKIYSYVVFEAKVLDERK